VRVDVEREAAADVAAAVQRKTEDVRSLAGQFLAADQDDARSFPGPAAGQSALFRGM